MISTENDTRNYYDYGLWVILVRTASSRTLCALRVARYDCLAMPSKFLTWGKQACRIQHIDAQFRKLQTPGPPHSDPYRGANSTLLVTVTCALR
jgi:hypothetical protein